MAGCVRHWSGQGLYGFGVYREELLQHAKEVSCKLGVQAALQPHLNPAVKLLQRLAAICHSSLSDPMPSLK